MHQGPKSSHDLLKKQALLFEVDRHAAAETLETFHPSRQQGQQWIQVEQQMEQLSRVTDGTDDVPNRLKICGCPVGVARSESHECSFSQNLYPARRRKGKSQGTLTQGVTAFEISLHRGAKDQLGQCFSLSGRVVVGSKSFESALQVSPTALYIPLI